MTTATPEQVLEQKLVLQTTCDPRTAVTERERDDRATLSAQLARDIVALRSHPTDIANIDTQLAPLRAAHARLLQAEQTLLERDATPDVVKALAVLRNGVPYVGDVAVFPSALRQLLTDTCPTCGHESFGWLGSLDSLEGQIADLERRRDYYQRHLDAALTPRELVTS